MRARASPRKCRVCKLPASELYLVNGGLLAGWSPRSIAARFNGINRCDVQHHSRNCVNEKEEKSCEQ